MAKRPQHETKTSEKVSIELVESQPKEMQAILQFEHLKFIVGFLTEVA